MNLEEWTTVITLTGGLGTASMGLVETIKRLSPWFASFGRGRLMAVMGKDAKLALQAAYGSGIDAVLDAAFRQDDEALSLERRSGTLSKGARSTSVAADSPRRRALLDRISLGAGRGPRGGSTQRVALDLLVTEVPVAVRSDIRWSPPQELTPAERKIMKKLTRTGRLYAFLRQFRHRLFDEVFQAALAEAYADTSGGRPPVPPALLVMVTLLQAYGGISDAEAVHLALFDRRWQMVLDCAGCEEAPFSQGLLAESRFRLIRHDLDRELIRRTVALAKETGGFGYKALRVALDSAPIWGAGRVEDTFNLVGHGLMMCVARAADAWELESDEVVAGAKLQIVGRSSVKAALDIDWDDAEAKARGLDRLLADVTLFRQWLAEQPRDSANKAAYEPLDAAMLQLARLVDQDVEPDPDRDGGHRVIDGTAKDRQVSVEDPEMRHGRKSKSTTINGYKGHIAQELDHELVLDALAEPANKREHAAADLMRPNIEFYAPVTELHIDRGFLAASWVTELDGAGVPVFSKPWNPTNHGLYPKSAFTIDMRARTVTCPAGGVVAFPAQRGSDGTRHVSFKGCATCPVRSKCTTSKRGRAIVLHEAEDFLQRLQAAKRTPEGREQLRERVVVEHGLAHVLVYAPHKARYRGARKNTFALRRGGAIVNLQATHRLARAAA